MASSDARWNIFRKIAPFFGRTVSARFVQRTHESISGVDRIHNLIEGIYKPAEATHALTIASMLANPYADRIEYNTDRTWSFYYSPKSSSLESAVNRSLFNCMKDGEPVLVIKQISDKTHSKGARYKLLGLGVIEEFDAVNRLFKIHEVTIEVFQRRIGSEEILSDELIETALQLEALEDWSPFMAEDRAVYKVSRIKRDAAFRKIVLETYENTCAVTQSKFASGKVIEAQAAHIISKEANGTDDPRNGIAMSRTTHWAFDMGIFTISDQFEIIVHRDAIALANKKFGLIDMKGQRIMLPEDESRYPHRDALLWHKEEVFGLFRKGLPPNQL